ncbi:Gcd10p family-domain-containing protein [Phyllosticta capitalensis]|uniref:tRNA (adenine(58)-N(1))-methyltransferase non-catalytic subunit TRM6 n=1 Tax=Phyllosticta capitalensis TaxID=121624 RepID=A0ABR1Z312_9PEZI
MVHSRIRPHTHIVLRLPSGLLKVVEIAPNTTINIGKFGSFPANQLLGRPYNLTYEILDREDGKERVELRVVPASELHEEVIKSEEAESQPESATPTVATNEGENGGENGGVEFDIVAEDGSVLMRSNRLTIDDPSRQALSMEEIEELKKAGTGSGMDIIKKIMAAHKALDEKTSFSLAKYTLRKSKKYLKRFEVLPMDAGMLAEVMLEKEAHRIMESREEMLGLIGAWGNVHYGGASTPVQLGDGAMIGGGRWLVVDETGGLIVASMAEKMGILYPPEEEDDESSEEEADEIGDQEMVDAPTELESAPQDQPEALDGNAEAPNGDGKSVSKSKTTKAQHNVIPAQSATTNSITLLHSAAQPNLGLLKYFNFDASSPSQSPTHPLHKHLKTISWLQLLDPTADVSYEEPETVSPEVLATWKSGKRGTYYRKRRRWERIRRVIAETRGGGFDGLIIASWMNPTSILRHTVPLLRGGAQVVAYSPTIEPLSEVMDFYSRERKAAFIHRTINANKPYSPYTATDEEKREFDEDFPVNPTLLLAPMLQTSRVRAWQVLPGRTHPLMTSKGGAEGFVFTGTRVLPAEGPISARGNFGKKRKTAGTAEKTDDQVDREKEAKKAKVEGETGVQGEPSKTEA